MSVTPLITFKAGVCELDTSSKPYKITPTPTPGYVYLYIEDDLPHFCWRPRSAPMSDPTLDLIMFPGDGTFTPYKPNESESSSASLTNGRIYVLRFSSSSARHIFWLQSSPQHSRADFFSPRDKKIGEIVNAILQGEEVDVQHEMATLPEPNGDGDDVNMEDADNDLARATSGGAGADATGGDFREEGEESREGGEDGGRAASTTQAAVANFLASLQGNQALSSNRQATPERNFTTLPDLLQPLTTLPVIDKADEKYIDELLSHVPRTLLLLAQQATDIASVEATSETAETAIAALSAEQKKGVLRKVLRSAQFSQSLGSLTMALRDGGLPTISDALKIKVANGGYMAHGGMPLGGGDAVEAFLQGIKTMVEDEEKDGGDARQRD